LWHAVYPILAGDRPGLSGALTARAAPLTLRLALLYALLDRSAVIRAPHLMAGLALWDYCERSVRFLFGDRTGNPVADDIRELLGDAPNGLTRSELVAALGRHQHGDKLTASLKVLEAAELARRETVPTGGRPGERWHAIRFVARESPLMRTARQALAECDQSDECDRSPRPPPPIPPFDRFRRFGRTSDAGDSPGPNATARPVPVADSEEQFPFGYNLPAPLVDPDSPA